MSKFKLAIKNMIIWTICKIIHHTAIFIEELKEAFNE